MSTPALAAAYHYCHTLAYSHYENFPVATQLLPRSLRPGMTVIYTFARTADDIVDEGHANGQQRLAQLEALKQRLEQLPKVAPEDHLMLALNDTLKQHDLPISAFLDLLKAFRQDIIKQRYPNHHEVLDYCRYSANPVGRLVLALFKQTHPMQYAYSDHICTMLQLINFLQDIPADFKVRNRIYLPVDDLKALDLSPDDLLNPDKQVEIALLMQQELDRCQHYLNQGHPLIDTLSGRLKLYIALIVHSAQCIINKLRQRGGHILQRPILTKRDKGIILYKGLKSLLLTRT